MKPEDFILPNETDLENERFVLAAMMRNNESICAASEALDADDVSAFHRPVFRAVLAVWSRCMDTKMIDSEEVLVELVRGEIPGDNVEKNWRECLFMILDSNTAGIWFPGRAEMIRERSLRKQVVLAAQEMFIDAMHPGTGADEAIGRAQHHVMAIGGKRGKNDTVHFRDVVKEVWTSISNSQDSPGQSCIKSGLTDIDAKTGGFHDGELCIIACRPSVGKTAFGLTIAVNAAEHLVPVLIFSIEMKASELVLRVMSGKSSVASQFIRQERLSRDQLARLADAGNQVSGLSAWINDNASIRINQMRAVAKKHQAAHKTRLVIVDYAQLIDGEIGNKSRAEEVATISRGLKHMARELNVPVICLAQLNRDVEKRGRDARPMLSDLRESGALEQDADTVIFLHRISEIDEPGQVTEVIIAKQRNGPVGKCFLLLVKNRGKFENYAEEIPR